MFPALSDGDQRKIAIAFGERALTYGQLAAAASNLADRLGTARRVAVWANTELPTCLAVVAAVIAGVPAVPLNPRSGDRELGHILADCEPDLVLAGPDAALPNACAGVPRLDVHVDDLVRGHAATGHTGAGHTGAGHTGTGHTGTGHTGTGHTGTGHTGTGHAAPVHAGGGPDDAEDPALIVYTSGTTGPPKGVMLPRRAITSNLDALAAAWEWTAADELVHGLPLFHVHGLVLGVLGPLRLGGTVRHLGRFSSDGVAAALAGGATMMFGVPTMYHRLVADAERDPDIAAAVAGARLLVSGSAALPASDHRRISAATGQRVVERYGMTETLMNCAVRATGDRRPGYVGPALDGVQVRLVDESGSVLDARDDEAVGEIQVRGPNLFLAYLNRPDATADAFRDSWFVTGDVATMATDGYLRIVGRKATDLIKSGGFKIGAGEIENVLLEHPAVAEVAVTGEPDPDLGERVVAWVVPSPGQYPDAGELASYVAANLAPHKRPRVVHFLDSLPRNDLGKITKKRLVKP
jgi:malonyl-CoA/methylmalonyl-CoA synthetase